ncbi:winged helix-turn-helix domain-containing protein [Peribacillus asahii]|uniref:winged helix-turn-helix domain-containing protein n=1 Tax=Peribacillus asahii TaxID=228899 RepID=UPI003815D11D
MLTYISNLVSVKSTVSKNHLLLEKIWGDNSFTEDRTIDSHIRNIRDKLRQVNFPINQYLSTVWGVGYKWMNKE